VLSRTLTSQPPFYRIGMKDFFISYTGADQQWAEWIALQLHHADYSTILQAWDFHAGGNFVLEMHRAAKESSRTLAVLSKRYLDANFTNPEWAAAFVKDPQGNERLLVPVRIEDFKPDGLFEALIYIDLVGLSENDANAKLLTKIAATMQGGSVIPATVGFPGTVFSSASKGLRYPGTLPPVWPNLHRNANFTGREQILHKLHDSLVRENHTALTQQALYGLGGIGKTQVAIEYAYRYRASYDVVWWINAEEDSTLKTDYAELSKKLNLPEKDAAEQSVIIEAVRQWLDHNPGGLLIFDNARNWETIRHYLPQTPSGKVLVTSRNSNWRSFCSNPVEITIWSRKESVAFVQKRTGQSDETAADALAETLGDLPLALEQAAAYIETSKISITAYLNLYNKRRPELWKHESGPLDHKQTVATTFGLSLDEVEKKAPLGVVFLNLCAVIAPGGIPIPLITACGNAPEIEGKELLDELALNEAVGVLGTYSLVRFEGSACSPCTVWYSQ
jgi:hypothetical protein